MIAGNHTGHFSGMKMASAVSGILCLWLAVLLTLSRSAGWQGADLVRPDILAANAPFAQQSAPLNRDGARAILSADYGQGFKARPSDPPAPAPSIAELAARHIMALPLADRVRGPLHPAPARAFNPRAPPVKAA